jgi:hypothetical protein
MYISVNYKLLLGSGRENAKRLLGVIKIYFTYDLGQKKKQVT